MDRGTGCHPKECNARMRILPLKKNSPERNSAENGTGHCVQLEACPQMVDKPRVQLTQLFWASLSPLQPQLLLRQQIKVSGSNFKPEVKMNNTASSERSARAGCGAERLLWGISLTTRVPFPPPLTMEGNRAGES